MNGHESAELYEGAIRRFQEHLKRADDGTFYLTIEDAKSIGVDPVVFADLKRSLDETNRKIISRELDPKKIEFA